MNTRILAAYAVFSELYSSKKNVYDVIRAFVLTFLWEKRLYQFTLVDFTNQLNSYYNFALPSAVIRSCLKKIQGIVSANGMYTVDYSQLPNINNAEQLQQADELSSIILNRLIDYAEKTKGHAFSEEERESLIKDFMSFLKNSFCHETSLHLITAFMVENEHNDLITKGINEIKEGIVIYTGITTDLDGDVDRSKLGSWKEDLTVYLDTEILFNIYGYNGDAYKQVANDFLSLVRDVNRLERYIQFRYFDAVKTEIDDFFYAAEKIIETGKFSDEKVAMRAIVDGCKSPLDVLEKKAAFFSFLESHSILSDDCRGYYEDEKNFKYNIECAEMEIHPYLNFINILRRGQNSGSLKKIRFILITGKSQVLQQAWDKNIYAEKDIPRATTMEYMTERLWFILNKGFGESRYFPSFDVVHKSKIVLSGLVASSVSRKFEDLNKRVESGELSLEQASGVIADIRQQSRLPEDIHQEDIKSILNSLTETDISRTLEERALKEQQLNATLAENSRKDEIISRQEAQLEFYKQEYEKHEALKKARREYIRRAILCFAFVASMALLILCFTSWRGKILLFCTTIFGKHGNALSILFSVLGFLGINVPSIILFARKHIAHAKKNAS